MIHSELSWPDSSEIILCPMDMAHSVHLHNHTPNISGGMSPEEVWKRSKSSKSALHNAYTWGFPAYVLWPILQDGNKLPKWITRSSRSQYFGLSPLYYITVGLVRKLQTGNISPQFHLVFDEYFDTVYSG